MPSKNKSNKTIGKNLAGKDQLADVLEKEFPYEAKPVDFDIDEKLTKDWLEKINSMELDFTVPPRKRSKLEKSRQYFKQVLINHKNNLSASLEPRSAGTAEELSLDSKTIDSPALVFATLCFAVFIFSLSIGLLAPNLSGKIIKAADLIFSFPLERPYQITRNFVVYGYAGDKADEPVAIARPIAKEKLANFIRINQGLLDKLAKNKITALLVKEEDMPGLVAGAEEKAGEPKFVGIKSSVKTAGGLFVKDIVRAADCALAKLFAKQKDFSLSLDEKIIQAIKQR